MVDANYWSKANKLFDFVLEFWMYSERCKKLECSLRMSDVNKLFLFGCFEDSFDECWEIMLNDVVQIVFPVALLI